jgi:hypothetical protein
MLLSVQRDDRGALTAGVGTEARALLFRIRIRLPRIRIRLPRIRLPRIRLPNIGRAIGRVVSGVGRAVGGAFRAVTNTVKKVANTVGRGVVQGFKTVAKGVGKIAKGVAQVAKGAGQAIGGVVKGAVKFGGGLIKAGGKLLKGDLKGAAAEFKQGAKAGFAEAKKGIVEGAKNIGKGVVKIADGVKDVTVGVVQVALPFAEVIFNAVKRVIGDKLLAVGKDFLLGALGKLSDIVFGPKVRKALETVQALVRAGRQIVEAIQNPQEYVDRGKEFVVDKLADLAMRVLEPPVKKVVSVASGLLLSLSKHVITTPLTAVVTTAIASVTLGIGTAAAPLIKMAIDKLFDLAIGLIEDKLGDLLMGIGAVRNFLKDKILRPRIDDASDAIMSFVRKKFPKAFEAGKKLLAKAQDVAGKVGGVLDKVGKAVDTVQDVLKAAKEAQAKGAISVNALVPKLNPSAIAREVKSVVKGKVETVVRDVQKLARDAITREIPALVPKAKAVAAVLAENAVSTVAEVVEAKSEAEAPVVEPKPEADLEGIRTGVRTVYSLFVQDWRAGLNHSQDLAVKGKGLEEAVRKATYQGLVTFRRGLQDAARLVYRVRLLTLKALFRPGLEEAVDQVNGALTSESAGTSGVLDAKIEGHEALAGPFDQSRAALGRFAQNGERFLLAGVELLTGRTQQTVKRVVGVFTRLVGKARQGLEEVSSALAPPPEEAEGGEEEAKGPDAEEKEETQESEKASGEGGGR